MWKVINYAAAGALDAHVPTRSAVIDKAMLQCLDKGAPLTPPCFKNFRPQGLNLGNPLASNVECRRTDVATANSPEGQDLSSPISLIGFPGGPRVEGQEEKHLYLLRTCAESHTPSEIFQDL